MLLFAITAPVPFGPQKHDNVCTHLFGPRKRLSWAIRTQT